MHVELREDKLGVVLSIKVKVIRLRSKLPHPLSHLSRPHYSNIKVLKNCIHNILTYPETFKL